uniref:Repressor-like protein n=1 Tax=Vibrio cholerae TaxID=666 RepID=A0A023UJ86_VIBCL|nr:repressor-like protein [Vibrio cholerae]AHY02136.1 repressor-like protein [Vibrio cholerae]AHY02137.1 repressor-like protein [Vibrio cholerae]
MCACDGRFCIKISRKSQKKGHEMEKRGDTTVRINEQRKMRLQREAIKIGSATGELLKISDIVNYLIDQYTNEAVKDLIDKKTGLKR